MLRLSSYFRWEVPETCLFSRRIENIGLDIEGFKVFMVEWIGWSDLDCQ